MPRSEARRLLGPKEVSTRETRVVKSTDPPAPSAALSLPEGEYVLLNLRDLPQDGRAP